MDSFISLLDDRNADLWKMLQQVYNFRIKKQSKSSYATFFEEDQVIIEVNEADLNPASFTHELLHVFLKQKNVLIAADLQKAVEERKRLNYIFSSSLKQHMGNCLEHEKMLPLFLQRGFNNEGFIGDYYDLVINKGELEELKNCYIKNGVVNRNAADMYIGKFFAVKAANNPEHDYSKFCEELEILDGPLWNALMKFWKNWLNYSIDESPKVYKDSVYSFMEDLDKWAGSKVII